MKKFLALFSAAVITASLGATLFGNQANAVVNGSDALQQYGAVSIWNFDNRGVFRHRCTGSLINPYWAVTAAHCDFANPDILIPNQTSVRAASLNNASGYQEVGLEAVYVHPDFQAPPSDGPNINDIALIKFKHPVTNSQLLTLSSNSPAIGTQGKAAGWGWHCDDIVGTPGATPNCGLPYTNVLQETTLQVVEDSRCEYFSDSLTQICTVGANGKYTMVCRGDSGAPLVRKSFDKWILMGTVSGDGDLLINHPNECDSDINGRQGTGRFTDIAPYRQWIIDTIYGL
ncbi:MAG TPA: serine protease [Candidatus Saccharimonadales bacterium]|nr:serine protease [Candidatus Saccharimonadales bacterium]